MSPKRKFTGLIKGMKYDKDGPKQCYICHKHDGMDNKIVDNEANEIKYKKL